MGKKIPRSFRAFTVAIGDYLFFFLFLLGICIGPIGVLKSWGRGHARSRHVTYIDTAKKKRLFPGATVVLGLLDPGRFSFSFEYFFFFSYLPVRSLRCRSEDLVGVSSVVVYLCYLCNCVSLYGCRCCHDFGTCFCLS